MNLNTFHNMSYGVYVVTALDNGQPVGCIANSIMQITSSPATVAVSINHDNYTNGCIAEDGRFAFSILSEQSDPSLIGTFGFQSSRDTDKFSGISYEKKDDLPVISDSCGYVVCKVINTMETSTHTVFLGEVMDADLFGAAAPAMTYSYYHNVIRGKSPKNAPTYLQEEKETGEAQKTRWVCQICGYVYEGDELPADYICPVCKQGADKFKKES